MSSWTPCFWIDYWVLPNKGVQRIRGDEGWAGGMLHAYVGIFYAPQHIMATKMWPCHTAGREAQASGRWR